ncbi:hypothetical protein [Sphingomonas sp. GB1N7]|uniref:hypothetical protein n=1 Tax=Parasphingomonas caseinilytica TaxID=3096158 RepID=UPI002FC9B779
MIASIAAHSLKEAKQRVAGGTGPAIAAGADLAYRVRAELEGSEEVVKIEKNGPDTRMVDEGANTTWTWFVTPKTTDPITLTLSFYNEFHRDGEVGENDGPAYETTFQVNANWRDKFVLFITDLNPIYAVIAGLVTTVGGGLIWIRNWRKKPEPIHGGRTAVPQRNWFRRRW